MDGHGATVSSVVDVAPEAVAMVPADPRAFDGIVVGSRRIRWFDARWPDVGTRFHHTVGLGPVTVQRLRPAGGHPAPLARLDLERHGLRWAHAPSVLAHPARDGPAVVLHRSPEATAAALARAVPGDGDAWLQLYGRWIRDGRAVLRALPPAAGCRSRTRDGRSATIARRGRS
jgi:hypothetical protein